MFKNMKIAFRIGLGFSIVLIFMVGMISFGLVALEKLDAELETIVKVENLQTEYANQMIDNAHQSAISTKDFVLAYSTKQSDATFQKNLASLAEKRKMYQTALTRFEELRASTKVKGTEVLSKIEFFKNSAQKNQDKVIELVKRGKFNDGINFMFETAFPSVQEWIASIETLIDYEESRTLIRFQEAQNTYYAMRKFMLILGIFAFLFSVIIVIVINKTIAQPIIGITKIAERIAAGDLNVEVISNERKDEVGILNQAFCTMVEKLRGSIKEIIEGITLLGSSASEILAATTQVASGSAETATAITETTTTVEEVRQAAQLSSQKASRVSENAQQVAQVTQTGQTAVDETVNGMHDIQNQMEAMAGTIIRLSEQSQEIGGIIAAVTDVADQSNLLAVNASIEAAKAGEQGKGFAVVAQEIKNLAQQSKQATIQVRNILTDVQKATSAAVMATEQTSKAVENGVKQSTQAGEAIKKLAESSSRALEAASQIVASSEQQTVGMDQIGIAMTNINQAGTENAASMLQAEKAAKGLHELGQKLKLLVEQYKI